MSTTTVIVQIQAKSGQGAAAADALGKAVQATVQNAGCYRADLVVDEDDGERMAIYSEWASAAAHKEYAAALAASPKMAALSALLEGPPKSTYYRAHAHGGGQWGGPGHLELGSNDPAVTRTFLQDVFHWRFSPMMEGYDGFWAPGAIFGGLRPKMEEEAAPQTIPYLTVDDIEARMEQVQAAGGTITVPIQEVPNAGRFFWFLAPGGLPLAVWESVGS